MRTMNHARTIIGAVLCTLVLAGPIRAVAQEDDARDRARQILAGAQAHEAEERYALAAQRYMELYDVLHGAQMSRAPVALWSAGNALSQVPGREREAVETLRRFLSESTTLTDDEHVRDWRSTAISLIEELEARAPTTSAAEVSAPIPESALSVEVESDGSISPIGPIVLGVGGAVLLSGLVTIGVAYGQDQNLVARCPERVGCDESMAGEVEATRTLGLVGDVLWIAGAAVALTGLVLTFVLEDDPGERAEVQVGGVQGGAVASLRWRFQ